MPLTAGTTLGPYEVIGLLGAGGMGEVYRARDTRLQREVAVKVLPESVAGGEAWARFQREARAASALNHPHICAVYDVGESAGRPFLIMELLEGQTLFDVLSAGPLDARTTIQLGLQIIEALEAAHAKGVIHRDIKPGNIMITGRRHVKVLDFGLAKHASATESSAAITFQALTQTGLVMGTPLYMAPEVLQGQAADARSDLWAFGVVFYQMLSGHLPFEGGTPIGTASAILHQSPLPLNSSVSPELRSLVARCLAKSPEERFQRAAEIREALDALGTVGADRIANDTGLTVTGAPASPNAEANDAFALAMQFLRVQNDIVRGQKQLDRAVALDPHFAEALRYHAFNYVVLLANGFSNDVTLLYAAEDELRQAEAEDPTLASLPSAFAAVYLAQGRKEMIPVAALDRACAHGTAARDALLWRAILAWMAGDSRLAQELARRSLEKEPLFGAPRMILGEMLRFDGDVQGAIREQLRVLEQAPLNISAIRWLSLAYLDAGSLDQARTVLEESRGGFQQNFLWRSAWALMLACEGKRSEAIEAMDAETLKFSRSMFIASLELAEFYAVLGDASRAVESIEGLVRNGDERVEWMRRSPRLASLQTDARFQRILQSIEKRRALRTAEQGRSQP